MAAPSEKHGDESDDEDLTESDDVHPGLDVLSPAFDPLKALYSPGVVLPFPSAATFNNLSEYESFIHGQGRGRAGRGRGRGRGGELSANARKRQRKKELKAKAAGLQDTPQNVMRNVLSRMSEQTQGPYSLLYTCVQKRCKIRVCVRSFKGLRGICTGYLVAFDREMNMALSDVDEVYRIPSTGQRFYHEEKLTYSKIIEYSKIRSTASQHSTDTSRYRSQDRSERSVHVEQTSGRGQKGTSKSYREEGSKSSSGSHPKRNTKPQGARDEVSEGRTRTERSKSKGEDDKVSGRRSDDVEQEEEEDEEALRLKLQSLKEELARLSPEDPGTSVSDEKTTGCGSSSMEEHKASGSKDSVSKTWRKTSEHGDSMCEPMAFEKQLMKSRTDKLQRTQDEAASTSQERTKGQRSKSTDKGSRSDSKTGDVVGRGGGNLRIKPEDFKRRHVNQLFLRGDNVVLVSVDKALLGKT